MQELKEALLKFINSYASKLTLTDLLTITQEISQNLEKYDFLDKFDEKSPAPKVEKEPKIEEVRPQAKETKPKKAKNVILGDTVEAKNAIEVKGVTPAVVDDTNNKDELKKIRELTVDEDGRNKFLFTLYKTEEDLKLPQILYLVNEHDNVWIKYPKSKPKYNLEFTLYPQDLDTGLQKLMDVEHAEIKDGKDKVITLVNNTITDEDIKRDCEDLARRMAEVRRKDEEKKKRREKIEADSKKRMSEKDIRAKELADRIIEVGGFANLEMSDLREDEVIYRQKLAEIKAAKKRQEELEQENDLEDGELESEELEDDNDLDSLDNDLDSNLNSDSEKFREEIKARQKEIKENKVKLDTKTENINNITYITDLDDEPTTKVENTKDSELKDDLNNDLTKKEEVKVETPKVTKERKPRAKKEDKKKVDASMSVDLDDDLNALDALLKESNNILNDLDNDLESDLDDDLDNDLDNSLNDSDNDLNDLESSTKEESPKKEVKKEKSDSGDSFSILESRLETKELKSPIPTLNDMLRSEAKERKAVVQKPVVDDLVDLDDDLNSLESNLSNDLNDLDNDLNDLDDNLNSLESDDDLKDDLDLTPVEPVAKTKPRPRDQEPKPKKIKVETVEQLEALRDKNGVIDMSNVDMSDIDEELGLLDDDDNSPPVEKRSVTGKANSIKNFKFNF